MNKNKILLIGVGCALCLSGFIIATNYEDVNTVVESYKSTTNGAYTRKHLEVAIQEARKANNIKKPSDVDAVRGDVLRAPENYDADVWIAYINNLGISDARKVVCVYALTQYKNRVPYSQAKRQLSVDNPTFIDCSSLVYNAHWKAGLQPMPPNNTAALIDAVTDVDMANLLPGDIAVYRKSDGGHTMIYMGTNSQGPVWCHASGVKEGMKLNPRPFDDILSHAGYTRSRIGSTVALVNDRAYN